VIRRTSKIERSSPDPKSSIDPHNGSGGAQSRWTLDTVRDCARRLFTERGYEDVGIRDIASAVGAHPVQFYRLGLTKSGLLAEVALALGEEQIAQMPDILKRCRQDCLESRVIAYLQALYELDIAAMPIRSVSAGFGWQWREPYEGRIIAQVIRLLEPVAIWLREAGLDQVEARCMIVWSLYYVGFRAAVMHQADAAQCIAGISQALKIALRRTPE
jgi:AcrR family transcriptional regulator